MQILIENGYVSSYALIGTLVGGIEVPDPPDIEHFEAHFQSYLVRDGTLEYDEQQNTELKRKALCDDLRKRRETECFSYINRGQLCHRCVHDCKQSFRVVVVICLHYRSNRAKKGGTSAYSPRGPDGTPP